MRLAVSGQRLVAATCVAVAFALALALPAAAHDRRWRGRIYVPPPRIAVAVPAIPVPRIVVVRERGYRYDDYAPPRYDRGYWFGGDDWDSHHRHHRDCDHW
jgi:hypothetical protein